MKGIPPLSDLTLVNAEQLILDEDGQPAQLFDAAELAAFSSGFFVASANGITEAVTLHFEEEPFPAACAGICKAAAFRSTSSLQKKELQRRYSPTEFEGTFTDMNGKAYVIQCMVFQFGTPQIQVMADEAEVNVNTAAAQFIQVSVQIPNLDAVKDFESKTKTSFAKATVLAAGAKNVYAESVPRCTRVNDALPLRREKVTCVEGQLLVPTAKINDLWRRSGFNNKFFRPWGRDEEFDRIVPRGNLDLDATMKLAQKLGDLAFGVALDGRGFAIKVKPEQKVQALQALDPTLAAAIGDEVLTLPRGDGCFVKITGVPFQMTDHELVQHLTLPTLHGNWTCQPVRRLTTRNDEAGTKTILARAAKLPPRSLVKLRLGHRCYPVFMTEQETDKKQETPLDKAQRRFAQPTTGDLKKSYIAAAAGATPKAAPKPPARTNGALPCRPPWADVEDDAAAASTAGDAGMGKVDSGMVGSDDESQAGDTFADAESGADSSSGFLRPRPLSRFTSKSAPPTLQARLLAMEQQREQDRAKAAEDIAQIGREFDTKITQLTDGIAQMNDFMSAAQTDNAKNLATTASQITTQMDKMFALLSNQIAQMTGIAADPNTISQQLQQQQQQAPPQQQQPQQQQQNHTHLQYSQQEWEQWDKWYVQAAIDNLDADADDKSPQNDAHDVEERQRSPRGAGHPFGKFKLPIIPKKNDNL